MSNNLATQNLTLSPGEIAIVVSYEGEGTVDASVQYSIYDNTAGDEDDILPLIVRGLCHVAATDPQVIQKAYKDYLSSVAEDDQPEWARKPGGNA